MQATLIGFMWLLLTLGPLLFFRTRLHAEIQSILLILTRRADLTMLFFAFLFFPGVLLHELSHFIFAKLLGVRTGGFSLIPKNTKEGRLNLGYVEIAKTDPFRESVIGAAPLLVGGLFVIYAGLVKLDLGQLWQSISLGDAALFFDALLILPTQPDFWLWLYLTTVVSSTMMPSESDRQSWLPLALILIILLAIAIWAGAGGWMLEFFSPGLVKVMNTLSSVFGLATGLHLILWIPLVMIRKILNNVTGVEVV